MKIIQIKQVLCYTFLLLSSVLLWSGCEKDGNYPGGTISPYISLFDIRALYRGTDVTLNTDNMFGSNSITGIVVSDHSGGNLPPGLLVVQDRRRLNQLRGISIPIGNEANNYVPGDSVVIDVNGSTLTRIDGTLQITNIAPTAITKVSSGNTIPLNRVTNGEILANPDKYESTLVAIVKGGFDPLPSPTDVLAGDLVLNDGFGNLTLHTESTASFADNTLPILANFFGIIFGTEDANRQIIPQHRLRTAEDLMVLSSEIEIAPIVITGFMSDVAGGDANNEYIQLMATRDIDFAVTPFSVVTTNNAGASTPTGYPANGWATGGLRTYKMNLTTGTAAKGTYFYVGGSSKLINGANSTNISSANWIRAYNYNTNMGDDFGATTGNLLANSGNAFGMAVFEGTTVTVESRPIDVIFISGGGSLYTAGPPERGYRITNTDFYDVKNPITLADQPYFRSGVNNLFFAYNTADLGYFNMLGGVYNPELGRWSTARAQVNVLLTKQSTLEEIEGIGATVLKGMEPQEPETPED